MNAGELGYNIGEAISNIATYSAASAARANGISAAAQSAQGQFCATKEEILAFFSSFVPTKA